MGRLWAEVYGVVSHADWLVTRFEMDPLELVLDLECAASFVSPHQPILRLMGQALRMELGELRHDYLSVPARLVGRLVGYESKEVQELLDQLREWAGPPEGWYATVAGKNHSC